MKKQILLCAAAALSAIAGTFTPGANTAGTQTTVQQNNGPQRLNHNTPQPARLAAVSAQELVKYKPRAAASFAVGGGGVPPKQWGAIPTKHAAPKMG
jgi:hypothetical protein